MSAQELFAVTVPTVNEHIAGIFADGELTQEATIRSFRIVRSEGNRSVSREVEHYSLPMIIAERADASAPIAKNSSLSGLRASTLS